MKHGKLSRLVKLLRMCLTGVLFAPVALLGQPSPELIRRLDFDLALRLEHFDELDPVEQSRTRGAHLAWVKFLSSPARLRLDEIDFWSHYAERFPEITFSDIEAIKSELNNRSETKTLGTFLEESIQREAVGHGADSARRMARGRSDANWYRLEVAIKGHPNPILGVDIDNVILSTRRWAATVLQGFDHRDGTSYFQDLQYGPVGDVRPFAIRHLSRHLKNYRDLDLLASHVDIFVRSSYSAARYSRFTPALTDTTLNLRALQRTHPNLRLVFITNRHPSMRPATLEALSLAGFSEVLKQPESLQMVGQTPGLGFSVAEAKTRAARNVASKLGGQFVGFLDDKRATVARVENEIQGVVGLWILTVPGPTEENSFALRTNESPLGFYSGPPSCDRAYGLGL